MPFDSDIFVKPVQLENAYSPIFVTLSGIDTLVKPVQPKNAYLPIVDTFSGIVRLVKLVQLENTSFSILVTIPESVIFIGGYAFYNCINLNSVKFENINNWWCVTEGKYLSLSSTDTLNNASLLKSGDTSRSNWECKP